MVDFNKACVAKHTKYQPALADFVCPKCGVRLYVDGSDAHDSDDREVDCDGNHEQDELHCYKCGYRTTGRAFAQACVKKADLVPCECCKGKGFVPRKKKP